MICVNFTHNPIRIYSNEYLEDIVTYLDRDIFIIFVFVKQDTFVTMSGWAQVSWLDRLLESDEERKMRLIYEVEMTNQLL